MERKRKRFRKPATFFNAVNLTQKQIIKTIRKKDKKAIIVVGTPTWSQLGSDGTHNEVADSPSRVIKISCILCISRKKGLPVMVTEFGMSDASGNGQISTINTGKWLKRLDQINVSYFCWSLTNKNESSALLAPGSSKTGNWKKKDLSEAGRYLRKKYRAKR